MRFWLALAAAVSMCPLAAFEGAAVTISELTRRADLVVRGKVLEKSIRRDTSGRIVTEIRFIVIESWKGDPKTASIKVVQPGGTLGEQRDLALDDATFEINEDAVAFLKRNENGDAVILNSAQGKFRISKNEADNGAQKFAVSELKQRVQEAVR